MPERWKWGLTQGASLNSNNGFWLGYAFERLMYQNETIGSFYNDGIRRPTLQDVLSGTASEPPRYYGGKGPRVEKALAILFRLDRNGRSIERIEVSNLELYFDLHGLPLIWLGKVEPEESLNWIAPMYKTLSDEKRKREMICAIGAHKTPEIIAFLQPMLLESSAQLRAQAAFWIGNLDDERALNALKHFLPSEQSEQVLDDGMAGLNESESPAATQALSDWAERSDNLKLRKKAIFWLAQKAARNVQEKIKNIAFNDKDTEVEKAAVVALAEMEEGAGITQLIEIAKSHPNPEIRKTAIIFLGESGDPRARQILLDIIKN